jgi:hypothetical protein
VAVKLMLASLADNPHKMARFSEEIRIMRCVTS